MRQEQEPLNCQYCYFLGKVFPKGEEEPVCNRTGSLIKNTKVCLTGPLVSLPKTEQEMSELIEKIEKYWRQEEGK